MEFFISYDVVVERLESPSSLGAVNVRDSSSNVHDGPVASSGIGRAVWKLAEFMDFAGHVGNLFKIGTS